MLIVASAAVAFRRGNDRIVRQIVVSIRSLGMRWYDGARNNQTLQLQLATATLGASTSVSMNALVGCSNELALTRRSLQLNLRQSKMTASTNRIIENGSGQRRWLANECRRELGRPPVMRALHGSQLELPVEAATVC